MEALDKTIKELFITWSKQTNVQGPEQVRALIQALQLGESENAYALKQLEEVIQKAKQAGSSDKWPDKHPAVKSITEKDDFHLYLNITKATYSSDLLKMKPLVSLSPLDITTYGNQLKHTFSHIPNALRDVLFVSPAMASKLGKMAQVRRLLNNYSGDTILPPWSEDPRLWPNHDWSDYALACVNSQSGSTKGITTNSSNQEEQLNQIARAAVDAIENEAFVAANGIVAAVQGYFRNPGMHIVTNFETEVHAQKTVFDEFVAIYSQ
jgi:hypothetical protein